MTRKPETISFWMGRLPHWEVVDGRYFITIHLAGAIPPAGRNQIRTISRQVRSVIDKGSPNWLKLQRRIFAAMERWLDRAEYNTWLRSECIAETLIEAIIHRQRTGLWNVFEFVLMPSHLHIFCEMGRLGLKGTLEQFKRWTGHQAIRLLPQIGDRFWQREWFDHWSRSDDEDARIAAYIRNNPVKAGLATSFDEWKYGTSRLPGGM